MNAGPLGVVRHVIGWMAAGACGFNVRKSFWKQPGCVLEARFERAESRVRWRLMWRSTREPVCAS